MKTSRKKKLTCPRCGMKSPEGILECPDCGLVFARLAFATNKDAKRLIKRRETEYVLKTSKLPNDVSFVKLLLYSIFFGFFGGHCFYVGRYVRGSIMLANAIFIILCLSLNKYIILVWDGTLAAILSTLQGFLLLLWLWDVWLVSFRKFKVPVGIDLTKEEVKE